MSHGSGDEENYWPGYVDALTSMVQVLAFVMMMLAIAVYVLSQNVSKSAVESIAKAMDVKTPADASVSQLTSAIIAAAEKAAKAQKAVQAADGAASTPAPAAPASPPAVEVAKADAAAPAEGAELRSAEPFPLSAPLKPVVGKSLAVHFPERGFAVPAEEKARIETFLSDTKSLEKATTLIVQAYAPTGTVALTEARHTAFYRAMTLRAELIAHKLPADRIRIRVLDASDKSHDLLVELVAP